MRYSYACSRAPCVAIWFLFWSCFSCVRVCTFLFHCLNNILPLLYDIASIKQQWRSIEFQFSTYHTQSIVECAMFVWIYCRLWHMTSIVWGVVVSSAKGRYFLARIPEGWIGNKERLNLRSLYRYTHANQAKLMTAPHFFSNDRLLCGTWKFSFFSKSKQDTSKYKRCYRVAL